MAYGICLLGAVPLRTSASNKSEMVSQLLFGGIVEVIEDKKGWVKVKLMYDGYEGWADEKQITPLYPDLFEVLTNRESFITVGFPSLIEDIPTGAKFFIPPGSLIFGKQGVEFNIGENRYIYRDKVSHINKESTEEEIRKSILEFAGLFFRTSYLWGGMTPLGIDCSGLTQLVYKMAGIYIPRDSGQQALQGTIVNFLSEASPGDLAFFDNEEEEIIHTGIIIDEHNIMHASGKVRIDTIDHQGIYIEGKRSYTHKLRLIRSYF